MAVKKVQLIPKTYGKAHVTWFQKCPICGNCKEYVIGVAKIEGKESNGAGSITWRDYLRFINARHGEGNFKRVDECEICNLQTVQDVIAFYLPENIAPGSI